MSSLNKVQLIGNLGKDPEIRHMQSGDKVASFSVACGEKWKDKTTGETKEKTEWINCSVFGKLAEVIERYISKGSKIYVEGSLQTRKWKGNDGKDNYSTSVNVSSFIMLDGKKDEQSANNAQSNQRQGMKQDVEPMQDWGSGDLSDDIPFTPIRRGF